MPKLIPKNWESFQHYKNRQPPWIKLHRAILDDRKFNCLPDASRALAPCLWLIASESDDGSFDGDVSEIAFRVRQSDIWVTEAIKPLIDNGFFVVMQDASKPLAKRKRNACPETEEEKEKRRERERDARRRAAPPKPGDVSDRIWDDWLTLRKAKRAPVTQTTLDGAIAEAAKAGMTLEAFLAAWCRRGSQGLEAAWLKPEERGQVYESPRDRAARERMAQFAPGVAAKPPGFQQPAEVIDVAAFRVG